ncbi:hypothetical protein LguiB_009721 [Lonicera macranthoides]
MTCISLSKRRSRIETHFCTDNFAAQASSASSRGEKRKIAQITTRMKTTLRS